MIIELADQLRDELLAAKAAGDDAEIARLELEIYILENTNG